MDTHTIEKLEFDSIRRLLAEHAQCALGKDLALRVQPSRRASQVNLWLEQAREFDRWVELYGLPPFGGIRDLREQIKRAVPPARLEPEEFGELAATLTGLCNVRAYLQNDHEGFATIAKLAERVGDFHVIADRINSVIDARGKVRDDASDRLLRLRQQIEEVRQQTRAVFQRLLKQASVLKLLQYPNATFHADRMVLPVKAEQRGRLPGIVHRSSDSGQTLFVEPAEAVELNNQRINLLQAEQEEIGRILWELTHLVHLNQKELLRTLETAALIDLLAAKLRFAKRFQLIFPEINENHVLKLHKARNPVLMAMYESQPPGPARAAGTPGLGRSQYGSAQGNIAAGPTHRDGSRQQDAPAHHDDPAHRDGLTRRDGAAHQDDPGRREGLAHRDDPVHGEAPAHCVVPIDVRLGDDFDVMVITGPNTGGKTAALKTVGMIAMMAQCGLPIPAEAGSTLPVFEEIWIDVGDEQSLQQSLSTFSSHLSRVLDTLQKVRKQTLVLLDELGAGTDPDEGAAIGRAIVEHLLASGCLSMVTTHLGSLKAMAYQLKRVDNASVLFDVETLRPLYELRIGEPGASNAIAIASRLGMPKRLVLTARRHLTGDHRALNRAIAGTLQARRQAERARADAEKARQDAARETLTALDRAEALEKERQAFTAWVQKVTSLQPGDPIRVRSFGRAGTIVRVRLEKQQATVDLGQMQVDVPLDDLSFPEAGASKQ